MCFYWRSDSKNSLGSVGFTPLWMGWELLITNLASAPGGKEFWKERDYLFGEEFRRHVEDNLMKRTPHPDAKPMGAFSIGRPSE